MAAQDTLSDAAVHDALSTLPIPFTSRLSPPVARNALDIALAAKPFDWFLVRASIQAFRKTPAETLEHAIVFMACLQSPTDGEQIPLMHTMGTRNRASVAERVTKQANGGKDKSCRLGAVDYPSVTIGMPVFNGIEFIAHALTALSEQTYQGFKLLISDNASTDGTWDKLEQWAARDRRIALHRQDQNIGVSRNFRYVLDRADTEYFMWYAYDDWLAPNYIETLLGIAAANPGCELICPTVVHAEPDGSPIREIIFPQPAPSRLGRLRKLLGQPESARIYGLFRTQALHRAQNIAEDFGYTWAADQIAVLPFVLNDSICGTAQTTFFWRRIGLSKERYRPKTAWEQLRFSLRYLRFHLRSLRESSLSLREKSLIWPWLLRHANRTLESFWQRPLKRAIRRGAKRIVKTGRSFGDRSDP